MYLTIFGFIDDLGRRPPADGARGNGDKLDSVLDRVLLCDRAAEHSGPRPESDHALPRQQYLAAGSEPTRSVALQAGSVLGLAQRGRGARRGADARQGIVGCVQGGVQDVVRG
jgi:hypothetical protein